MSLAAVPVFAVQDDAHFVGQVQVNGDPVLRGLQTVGGFARFGDAPIFEPDAVWTCLCTCQAGARAGVAFEGMELVCLEVAQGEVGKVQTFAVGRAIVGTVKGDLHDIGKKSCCHDAGRRRLQGCGFGCGYPREKFVAALHEGADILGLSALLTTTMPSMENTIKAVEAAGLRNHVKIIIGGAPVTAEYAHQIGADGFAPDAGQAVTVAKSLIGK